MNAYTDAISNCSIKEAPWYVIPANRNGLEIGQYQK